MEDYVFAFLLALAVAAFGVGHAIGWRSGKRKVEQEPSSGPPLPLPVAPTALVFGSHYFIQQVPSEDEPWLVNPLNLSDGFYVASKEQAIELMRAADVYRDRSHSNRALYSQGIHENLPRPGG